MSEILYQQTRRRFYAIMEPLTVFLSSQPIYERMVDGYLQQMITLYQSISLDNDMAADSSVSSECADLAGYNAMRQWYWLFHEHQRLQKRMAEFYISVILEMHRLTVDGLEAWGLKEAPIEWREDLGNDVCRLVGWVAKHDHLLGGDCNLLKLVMENCPGRLVEKLLLDYMVLTQGQLKMGGWCWEKARKNGMRVYVQWDPAERLYIRVGKDRLGEGENNVGRRIRGDGGPVKISEEDIGEKDTNGKTEGESNDRQVVHTGQRAGRVDSGEEWRGRVGFEMVQKHLSKLTIGKENDENEEMIYDVEDGGERYDEEEEVPGRGYCYEL